MLGTKTKQVFSYGRRGHRIVNVSERVPKVKDENASPVSTSPISRKKLQPVILLSKRGKPVPASPEATPSPSPPRKRKVISKKAPSSPLSSPDFSHKPKRVRQIIAKSRGSKSQSTSATITAQFSTPISRAPLSTQSPNVPQLAAPVFGGKKKARVSGGNGTPLKQSLSPFVDVDIVVVDDMGRRLSHERRVSRTDVQVNPVTSVARGEATDIGSDSEEKEYQPVPKKPARRRRARRVVASSDESDVEEAPHRHVKGSYATSTKTSAPPSGTAASSSLRQVSTAQTDPASHAKEYKSAALSSRLAPYLTADTTRNDGPPSRIIPSEHVQRSKSNGAAISNSGLQGPSALIPTSNNVARSREQESVPLTRASSSQLVLEHALKIDPALKPSQHRGSLAATHSKLRQLTPIRYRHSNFPRPPSPISPSTSVDDLDFSIDLNELSLSETPDISDTSISPPKYLLPLLTECGQTTAHEFSAFIETFPFDPIVQQNSHPGTGKASFQKIGEASYSEVFGIGDVVLKVIPLRDEENKTAGLGEAEIPAPSDAKDVLKEMVVTREMGEMCDGFVRLLRTYVVKGRYPSLLLDLWDQYDKIKGSESIRPGRFFPSTSSRRDTNMLVRYSHRPVHCVPTVCYHSPAERWSRSRSIHFFQRVKDWLETSLQSLLAGHSYTGSGRRSRLIRGMPSLLASSLLISSMKLSC